MHQQMLKLADQTLDVVRDVSNEVRGPVKLGVPSSLALVLVGPLIAALEERYPSISLEVYESPSSYLAAHLINQQVDLSILVDDVTLSGIHAEPLMDERLYFVQPRDTPALKASVVELRMLAGVPLMLTTHATTLRHLVDRAFAEAGITPIVKSQASSIQTLLLMVARGGAGTIVPRSALAWHSAADLLQAVLIEPALVRRATLAYSRLGYLSPAASCVRDLLSEVVTQLVASDAWTGEIGANSRA